MSVQISCLQLSEIAGRVLLLLGTYAGTLNIMSVQQETCFELLYSEVLPGSCIPHSLALAAHPTLQHLLLIGGRDGTLLCYSCTPVPAASPSLTATAAPVLALVLSRTIGV